MYVGHRLLRTKFLPLFCSGVDWKAGITFGRLMKFSRCNLPRKRKIPPTQYRRRILSGETDGKMIGCVAGRYVLSGQSLTESGGYHGENHHFFSRIWNKRYHGSVGASIWFCDFYCDKAIEVRLIIANWFFNVSETSLVCISRIGDSVHNNISFCVNAGVIVSAGYIQ